MNKYNDFRDMSVWQKAFAILREIYKIIKNFPPEEKYALTDDLRRSSNSVVHNIAEKVMEDLKRRIKPDFIRFQEEVHTKQ